jgi:hypothetical protein
MIRDYEEEDKQAMHDIHKANELPEACLPDLTITDFEGKEVPNPLFVQKLVYEHEGKPALMMFLKVTSEVYLILDHEQGTPQERFDWLRDLKNYMAWRAQAQGFDQMTAWIPTDIEPAFQKRLKDLGFQRSAWQSYTLNLK